MGLKFHTYDQYKRIRIEFSQFQDYKPYTPTMSREIRVYHISCCYLHLNYISDINEDFVFILQAKI